MLRVDLLLSALIGGCVGWWVVPWVIGINGDRGLKGTPDSEKGDAGEDKGDGAKRIGCDHRGEKEKRKKR